MNKVEPARPTPYPPKEEFYRICLHCWHSIPFDNGLVWKCCQCQDPSVHVRLDAYDKGV